MTGSNMLLNSGLKEVARVQHRFGQFLEPLVFAPSKHEFQKHEPLARRLCLVLGDIEGDKCPLA
jgi:hypothetical protein